MLARRVNPGDTVRSKEGAIRRREESKELPGRRTGEPATATTVYFSIPTDAGDGASAPIHPVDDFASTQCGILYRETVHNEPIGLPAARGVPKLWDDKGYWPSLTLGMVSKVRGTRHAGRVVRFWYHQESIARSRGNRRRARWGWMRVWLNQETVDESKSQFVPLARGGDSPLESSLLGLPI